ncbi:MAG: DegV family protein [Clostridia bacterium]|nr:DegV family protein [Clostridia bacterium]
MQEFVLSCCSTADLSAERFEARDVSYICFHYELDGEQLPDDLGKTVPFGVFYQKMADGAETRTSQINVDEYENYFRGFLEEGKDVLHVTLSSGLSGSIQSARTAAEMALEQFPDRKLYVVDSLAASSGFGLLMDKLADLRDEGYTLEELRDWAEANRKRLSHWFFSSDLTFFVKGGRVSKAAGVVGGILNICPLMNVDFEGRLTVRKKVMGKKKVIQEALARMKETADGRLEYNEKCYICHSACLEDAKTLAAGVEEAFPNLKGSVEIYNIGTTIGSHTGPGTVALFFWGDERVD